MTLQSGLGAGLVGWFCRGVRRARCVDVMWGAVRGLVMGGVLVCVAANGYGHVPARCGVSVVEEMAQVRELGEGGITAAAQARVAVHRTGKGLSVRVLSGQVLLRPRKVGESPVVVTAGTARISHIDALACVGVEKDRTVVAVLDGGVEMAVLRGDGGAEVVDRMALKAGDRVELRRVREGVAVRVGSGGTDGLEGCADGVLRWAGVGR
jgi:ferric-dicitrate binding protein FerR (iron transport regulator)